MTRNYVLANWAEADLRGIIRYTRTQWSDAQVRRYISKLEQGFTRLASGKHRSRDMGRFIRRSAWHIASTIMSSACRAKTGPR